MGRKLHQERRMHLCAKIKAVLPRFVCPLFIPDYTANRYHATMKTLRKG